MFFQCKDLWTNLGRQSKSWQKNNTPKQSTDTWKTCSSTVTKYLFCVVCLCDECGHMTVEALSPSMATKMAVWPLTSWLLMAASRSAGTWRLFLLIHSRFPINTEEVGGASVGERKWHHHLRYCPDLLPDQVCGPAWGWGLQDSSHVHQAALLCGSPWQQEVVTTRGQQQVVHAGDPAANPTARDCLEVLTQAQHVHTQLLVVTGGSTGICALFSWPLWMFYFLLLTLQIHSGYFCVKTLFQDTNSVQTNSLVIILDVVALS